MTFARGTGAGAYYVVWIVGVIAALLTAFYMTRMMLYTFHGPNRTGSAAQEHVREAPWVMTGPLVVLAIGSALAGVINLPAILPASGWLHHWMEPVTEAGARYLPDLHLSPGTEWALLGLATVVAAAGILGAWNFLRPAELRPAREAPAESGLQQVLLRKWYVDELYDAIVVRPLMWVSDRALWRVMDVRVIDGAFVNGSAAVARALGWVGSRVQTGSVKMYMFLFVVGVLLLLRAMTR